MGEIVYAVHTCKTPSTDDLGLGSVYRCDCGNLFELVYYPSIPGVHLPTIPSSFGWTPMAPRWFDEATQTPVPKAQRIIVFETKEKTKLQNFADRMRRAKKW